MEQVLASRRRQLLNCAMWNEMQARKADKEHDEAKADRLWTQAERLYEQAEEAR